MVVPASGVSALSEMCTETLSRSTPSTSAAIWQSDEAWPPPTSGAPQRTTRLPSISKPTHALDQSWSQTMRP